MSTTHGAGRRRQTKATVYDGMLNAMGQQFVVALLRDVLIASHLADLL